jgi:ankyrin repeat protein
MKRFSTILTFLMCLTALDTLAILPQQIEQLTASKKSLNTGIDNFIKCLKGDKDCSPQKTKIIRAVVTLVGIIGLIAASGTAVYLVRAKSGLPEDLSMFASYGLLNVIKDAVEKNPSIINATDKEGDTMLHKAAHNGHSEVIKYLRQNGAQQTYNKKDKSPLDIVEFWLNAYPDESDPKHKKYRKAGEALIGSIV